MAPSFHGSLARAQPDISQRGRTPTFLEITPSHEALVKVGPVSGKERGPHVSSHPMHENGRGDTVDGGSYIISGELNLFRPQFQLHHGSLATGIRALPTEFCEIQLVPG